MDARHSYEDTSTSIASLFITVLHTLSLLILSVLDGDHVQSGLELGFLSLHTDWFILRFSFRSIGLLPLAFLEHRSDCADGFRRADGQTALRHIVHNFRVFSMAEEPARPIDSFEGPIS